METMGIELLCVYRSHVKNIYKYIFSIKIVSSHGRHLCVVLQRTRRCSTFQQTFFDCVWKRFLLQQCTTKLDSSFGSVCSILEHSKTKKFWTEIIKKTFLGEFNCFFVTNCFFLTLLSHPKQSLVFIAVVADTNVPGQSICGVPCNFNAENHSVYVVGAKNGQLSAKLFRKNCTNAYLSIILCSCSSFMNFSH